MRPADFFAAAKMTAALAATSRCLGVKQRATPSYAGAVYIKNKSGAFAALFISHLGGYQVPGRCPRCRLYCTPLAAGDNKQMFGVSQQVRARADAT